MPKYAVTKSCPIDSLVTGTGCQRCLKARFQENVKINILRIVGCHMLCPSHTISHIIACCWELFSQSLKQAKLLSQQVPTIIFFSSVIAKALRINVRSVCTVLLFNIVRATHMHASYLYLHAPMSSIISSCMMLLKKPFYFRFLIYALVFPMVLFFRFCIFGQAHCLYWKQDGSRIL